MPEGSTPREPPSDSTRQPRPPAAPAPDAVATLAVAIAVLGTAVAGLAVGVFPVPRWIKGVAFILATLTLGASVLITLGAFENGRRGRIGGRRPLRRSRRLLGVGVAFTVLASVVTPTQSQTARRGSQVSWSHDGDHDPDGLAGPEGKAGRGPKAKPVLKASLAPKVRADLPAAQGHLDLRANEAPRVRKGLPGRADLKGITARRVRLGAKASAVREGEPATRDVLRGRYPAQHQTLGSSNARSSPLITVCEARSRRPAHGRGRAGVADREFHRSRWLRSCSCRGSTRT
jgi:hypothetical protein